jgi:rare lipoprotein A
MHCPTRPPLSRYISLLDRSVSAWILIGVIISIGQGCSTVSVREKPPGEQAQASTPPIEVPSPTLAPMSPETPPPEAEASPVPKFVDTGLASWYGAKHHGKRTASGEIFNQTKFTAAHQSLPLGSMVKVTNLENGKSVDLRINDRGPYHRGRIIDVSRAAATVLGMRTSGIARVRVELISSPEAVGSLPQRK